jgi:hypothetical protein
LETVLAIGVVGMAVPLVLAAFGGALALRGDAGFDTRAAMIARSVHAELRRPGQANILGGVAGVPEPGAPRWLALAATGEFLRAVDAGEYTAGVAGAGYLVALEGDVGGMAAGGLRRLRMVVEAPGGAPARARAKHAFEVLVPTAEASDE